MNELDDDDLVEQLAGFFLVIALLLIGFFAGALFEHAQHHLVVRVECAHESVKSAPQPSPGEPAPAAARLAGGEWASLSTGGEL